MAVAVVQRVKEAVTGTGKPSGQPIPKTVEERVKRGTDRIARDRAQVECAWEFFRGNQYCWVNKAGHLYHDNTVSGVGSDKPRHRVRQVRNLIRPLIEEKVSAATQRIPGYEITPSTTDPQDIAGARLADKIALAGYDDWDIRDASVDAVTRALVGRVAYALPYFDSTVGPYTDIDGQRVGQGKIAVRVYGRNQVGYEPGTDFKKSRWFFVQEARPVEDVMDMPGYIGGKLEPDAVSAIEASRSKVPPEASLVLVTEYYERPTPTNADGRRLILAGGRVVCEPERYPCVDRNDQVVDEPILHRLRYVADPDSDEDLSLVEALIDPQRTYNDCNNKLLEWKNLGLNKQVFALPNTIKTTLTDEPGAVFIVNSLEGIKERDPGTIPNDLYRLKEEAKQDMHTIAAAGDIPPQIESSKAVQAALQRAELAWSMFTADLAAFHASLMRHCLYLVQRHYTEKRVAQIRGDRGWELPFDFIGSDIRGQTDVRVQPGSLEARTRQGVEQRIMNIATMFPGFLTPEKAIRAIESGTAGELIDSFEKDLGRAHRIIERLKQGPEEFFAVGWRFENGVEIPAWLPRQFDNVPIQKAIFEDWMKTPEYEELEPGLQEAANLYYEGLLWLEAQAQQRALEAQNAQAEQAGMTNATKPAQAKPMPSLPAAQQ